MVREVPPRPPRPPDPPGRPDDKDGEDLFVRWLITVQLGLICAYAAGTSQGGGVFQAIIAFSAVLALGYLILVRPKQ